MSNWHGSGLIFDMEILEFRWWILGSWDSSNFCFWKWRQSLIGFNIQCLICQVSRLSGVGDKNEWDWHCYSGVSKSSSLGDWWMELFIICKFPPWQDAVKIAIGIYFVCCKLSCKKISTFLSNKMYWAFKVVVVHWGSASPSDYYCADVCVPAFSAKKTESWNQTPSSPFHSSTSLPRGWQEYRLLRLMTWNSWNPGYWWCAHFKRCSAHSKPVFFSKEDTHTRSFFFFMVC